MFSKTDKNHKGGDQMSQGGNVAPSIISANLHIVGNLNTEGEVQVDGTIDGDVTSRALTVGENAKVSGEITADEVEIRGSIEGKVKARSVKLSKSAHVVGDIIHEVLSIESGAYIEGQLQRAENVNKVTPTKAAFGKKAEKEADVPEAPAASPAQATAPGAKPAPTEASGNRLKTANG
jgi:cytoskeletal protein CcmA (bactofilin family)